MHVASRVNFLEKKNEQILQIVLVFILLTLNK